MNATPIEKPVTLCDALDRLLSAGIVAHGDIVISVADVDLLRISLRALVAATDALCNELCEEHVAVVDKGQTHG